MLLLFMKLTRRTNVLFSEADYLALKALSKAEGKTMGELIRKAVTDKVNTKNNTKRLGVMKTLAEIEKLTKGVDFSGTDYKELVEYGRK